MKYEIGNSVATSLMSKTSIETDLDNNKIHPAQKKLSSIITSEESRGLSGVVAKTRALFESNTSSRNFSTPQGNTIKKNFLFSSVQVLKKEISINNEIVGENSNINKIIETPIKSILHQRDNFSKNKYEKTASDPKIQSHLKKNDFTSNRTANHYPDQKIKLESDLNSTTMVTKNSEEISKELNIPISVKQAKACFENLASISENFLTPVSKPSFSKWSKKVKGDLSDTSKISTSVSSQKNSKINKTKNMIVLPDIQNSLTSSSSSTGSESSVFNNSSGSSCEDTPILMDKNRAHKIHTTKVADRIKRLEECKSLGDNESKSKSKLSLSFNCLNFPKCANQTSPFTNSSRFSHLSHKQMEANPTNYRKLEDLINEADQNMTFSKPLIEENREKKLKSILRKAPNYQSFVVSEIKIETRSNVRSPSCSSSSPSCSPSSSFSSLTIKPIEQTVLLTKDNIDNSSCVVPSKIRQRAQSLDISNSQEISLSINNVSKMNNSFTTASKTPNKNIGSYIKNVSYSSGNSNCELVKRYIILLSIILPIQN